MYSLRSMGLQEGGVDREVSSCDHRETGNRDRKVGVASERQGIGGGSAQ